MAKIGHRQQLNRIIEIILDSGLKMIMTTTAIDQGSNLCGSTMEILQV